MTTSTLSDTFALPQSLADWLDHHAEALDAGSEQAAAVVPQLAAGGLLRRGVPRNLGGDGAPLSAAVQAIAAVAEHSLAAAFVFWGQRACIEYLVQGENPALRDRWLPELLDGRIAGATGLSNAMKFLSGIEGLGLQAQTVSAPGAAEPHWRIEGAVPWATNLHRGGFLVAVAVGQGDQPPLVALLPHDRSGLQRSDDLDLIALRGTHTAALQVQGLPLDAGDVIALNARSWLPRVRPAFLGLQCGLSIGLARVALAAAQQMGVNAKSVLGEPIAAAQATLARDTADLLSGVDDGRFITAPVPLFELRIGLANTALQAVQLELQASGGRAYHRDQPLGFARRWREAAFLPIVTPSLTQLEGELQKHRARLAAAAAAAAAA